MSIVRNPLFNSASSNNNESTTQKRSEFWINVGVPTGYTREDGSEYIITLPFGIPLDSMQYVQTNSKNQEWSEFQQARNSLLDELRKAASELAPGEERKATALIVTIRRTSEQAEITANNGNKFLSKIKLF